MAMMSTMVVYNEPVRAKDKWQKLNETENRFTLISYE